MTNWGTGEYDDELQSVERDLDPRDKVPYVL